MLDLEIKNTLATLNNDWVTAGEAQGLPEGFYTGVITKTVCKNTSGELPQLIFNVEITINNSLDFDGLKTTTSFFLQSKGGLGAFKSLVEKVDLVVHQNSKNVPDVVEYMLSKLLGAQVSFERKKNGNYFNNFIQSVTPVDGAPF